LRSASDTQPAGARRLDTGGNALTYTDRVETTPFEKLAGITLEGDDLADLVTLERPEALAPPIDPDEGLYAMTDAEFEAYLAALLTAP